jgi:hypothetical protein
MKALHRVTVDRDVLHKVNRRKATLIVHTLPRNCLLKHVCEEKIE